MAFTMFDKFGDAAEMLSREERDQLFAAMCEYGFYGIEPELPVHLAALFTLMRDDIDNSAEMRKRGSNGGRPRKPQENEVIYSEKPEVSENAKPEVSANKKPVVSDSEEPEVSGIQKPEVSENSKPKPNQTKPIQTKPKREKSASRRTFAKPSLDEVRAYVDEMGYTFDPEAFFNHYESNGWMVGRNHMKDWHAACRTWQSREKTKEVDTHEFDKFDLRDDQVLVLRGGA